MSSVDASIVFLPRFTTLVGATTFTTLPLDVSRYGGAQFQVWYGAPRTRSASPEFKFKLSLEESLDTETWVLGPSTPTPIEVPQADSTFLSYSFRLRWFRLKVEIEGDEPIVTCWAEGLLRGGGGGLWQSPAGPAASQQFPGMDVRQPNPPSLIETPRAAQMTADNQWFQSLGISPTQGFVQPPQLPGQSVP